MKSTIHLKYQSWFCLFQVFRPKRIFFTYMETSPLLVKGCTVDLCSTLISVKQCGFLACHSHSDTEHIFIKVISEDMWHWHPLSSVAHWTCHYLFFRLRSVAAGIQGKRGALSNRLRHKLLMYKKEKCITEIMCICAKLLGIHHTNFSDTLLRSLTDKITIACISKTHCDKYL